MHIWQQVSGLTPAIPLQHLVPSYVIGSFNVPGFYFATLYLPLLKFTMDPSSSLQYLGPSLALYNQVTTHPALIRFRAGGGGFRKSNLSASRRKSQAAAWAKMHCIWQITKYLKAER